ncbi:MAG: tetratricopeptide repeat protein [Myxococcota bacterium]
MREPRVAESGRAARLLAVALTIPGCALWPNASDPLLESAIAGDLKAQNLLCHAYLVGKERQKDPVRAVAWCRRAADHGEPNSQTLLGEIYLRGADGVAQDYAEALRWYSKAADAEHPHAQFMIGSIYAAGLGVERNLDLATEWYEKARRQGYTEASMALIALEPRKLARDEPCRYQGTVHRLKRWDIDQALQLHEISRKEWLCQTRALEEMDRSLGEVCAERPAEVDSVFKDQRAAFGRCLER